MLHVHQAHLANLGAVVVSRVLGKPAVATFHSVPLGTTSFGGMLERTSQSIIPRLCAGVAFVSEQTQREFGIGGQVIHNGVDPDRFPRTTNSRDRLRQSLGLNGFVVAFSGRRTRSKGYFDLLRAISRARTAGVDVRLIAMGDSSAAENDKAQSLARELGLSDSLRDLGRREDSSLVLRAADAFALPSYHEGLPLGILEALAAPLPIVASNVGGIPEIIRDGKEGFLLPPGDVEGLAERLVRLARNPFLAASLAENARERAKSFTLTRTVESYVRFYQAAWNRSVAGRGNP